jgi:MEKHLA domain
MLHHTQTMEKVSFSPPVIAHGGYLARSFSRLLGRALLPSVSAQASDAVITQALYYAPVVIVAHGTQPDPLFCFANKVAQQLWGIPWSEFIGMPSRLSAEAEERATRAALLTQAQEKGFIDNYSGIRIARSGKRFRIREVILFTVSDDQGKKVGQAATFDTWEWL